ncbi:MAG: amino acid permease [Candidatus Melainabacteria bacterium]|nr:amino acid permease [Candidatus Melainabacteria bacterium]
MAKGLFVKKSIKTLLDEAQESRHSLKRTLGPINLTALGIGAIIGAGIFVLTGPAAAQYAGPGILLSFVFAALICVFAALCYAEFASLIPISGSAYTYAYATMGELIAWIIGWGLTMEFMFSVSTVAVGWSAYFTSLIGDFGMALPTIFAKAPLEYSLSTGWAQTGSYFNLPAMVIVALMGTLVAVGIKAAASFNNVMVVIKLGVIVLFLACGVAYINWDNLTPFIPQNTGTFGEFGISGVLRGAGVVFFAFIGFDALSTMAQESRNPQKDLPIGMLGSLGISTFVYILIGIVMLGLVSYATLDVPDPIAVAVNALGPKFVWLRLVIKLAILAGLTSVVLVMQLSQARIFYSMAKDGLLPKKFAKISDRFHTPFFATAVVTTVCMILAGIFPVDILGQLTNMGALLAFAIVCFGILVLRYKQPNLHRPFKTPFVPWIPLAGTLVCLIQMFAMPGVTWMQFIIWMAIGMAIYFGYSAKHSHARAGLVKKK